jgi:phage terminase Nu1 subunit (DNA packaging protein)
MIADRTTTARIFDVSTDTVRAWQKAGCPYREPENPRGTPAQRRVHYETARVHEWLVQRALRSAYW